MVDTTAFPEIRTPSRKVKGVNNDSICFVLLGIARHRPVDADQPSQKRQSMVSIADFCNKWSSFIG